MYLLVRDSRISLRPKLLVGALAVTLFCAASSGAQTVATYNFADGGLGRLGSLRIRHTYERRPASARSGGNPAAS